MGLDVSHDCWSGGYSAFGRFRAAIAQTIGVHLDAMHGFSGDVPGVQWWALKPDPLHILLDHSDCDGIIEHKDCEPLARRLYEIIPLLPEKKDALDWDWRERAKRFADGLMKAHEAGEEVDFH